MQTNELRLATQQRLRWFANENGQTNKQNGEGNRTNQIQNGLNARQWQATIVNGTLMNNPKKKLEQNNNKQKKNNCKRVRAHACFD